MDGWLHRVRHGQDHKHPLIQLFYTGHCDPGFGFDDIPIAEVPGDDLGLSRSKAMS